MPPSEPDFNDLFTRARNGCREAATFLVTNFSDLICRVIRRRLRQKVRSLYDSTDILQDVWKTCFSEALDDHTFDCPEKFSAFLTKTAERRVADLHRNELHTQKRAGVKKQPLPPELPDPSPDPAKVAETRDAWRQLGQLDPKVEKAFQLLRAGHSHAEVAQLLGVSPRMIGRVIERAREFAAQQARVAVSPPP